MTLVRTLWKGDSVNTNTEDTHLKVGIYNYIEIITKDHSIRPCFDTFYEYLSGPFKTDYIEKEKVAINNFDVNDMLQVLKPFYKGGMFDFYLTVLQI